MGQGWRGELAGGRERTMRNHCSDVCTGGLELSEPWRQQEEGQERASG